MYKEANKPTSDKIILSSYNEFKYLPKDELS
jgi:YesN/AraC family two-component response regulator